MPLKLALKQSKNTVACFISGYNTQITSTAVCVDMKLPATSIFRVWLPAII